MKCTYCGKIYDPTIVIKAVALKNLWIWHGFFSLPGTLNNINVLQRSLLFARLAAGDAPTYSNKIMDNVYTLGYHLTDGIYPEWAILVKSIKEKGQPLTREYFIFTKAQEAARKDIERPFGGLQVRFALVRV
jgi:hypothetical protein